MNAHVSLWSRVSAVRRLFVPLNTAIVLCTVSGVAHAQNLQDFGGPVMQAPKVFLIFWLPKGNHFDPANAGNDLAYMQTLDAFFSDASSGTYLNIASEYPGTCSPPTIPTNQPCFGTVTSNEFMYVDTRPYPHAGTTTDPLQDGDIQTEVANVINSSGLTPTLATEFFVFLGANINECGPGCTFNGMCAYHSNFRSNGSPVIYATMPDLAGIPGCNSFIATAPNLLAVDLEIVAATHEFMESMTDPLIAEGSLGWYDLVFNGEIGDICTPWRVGLGTLSPDGSNIVLNGHHYVVQLEWDNDGASCAIGFATALAGRTAEITTTTGSTALNANSTATATFEETGAGSQSITLHAGNQDPQWSPGAAFAKVYAQPSLGSNCNPFSLSDVDFTLSPGPGSPNQWPLNSAVVKLRNPNGTFECEQSGSGSPLGTATSTAGFRFTTASCAPQPSELTVQKILMHPSSRSLRLFNLQIDGKTVLANTNSGSTGPQQVQCGTHQVGETAGTGTSLDWFETVIGGACAPNGSVTLAAGDSKTCTITNYDHLGGCGPAGVCCEPGTGTGGCTRCAIPPHTFCP